MVSMPDFPQRSQGWIAAGLMCLPLVASAQAVDCTRTSINGSGGLPLEPSTYFRSAAKLDALLNAVALIEPLDASGTPSETGKVCELLIGMSNAQDYGSALESWLEKEPYKSPRYVYVNGAKPNMTATEWANPAHGAWTHAANKLAGHGCAPPQVQVAHVVMTQREPATNGGMTDAQMRAIVANVVTKYPNTRWAELSGITTTIVSNDTRAPEPFVHDDSILLGGGRFANDTVVSGIVDAGGWPVPVDFRDLWSLGPTPNPLTGFRWFCSDVLSTDGVHPTQGAGKARVALHLIDQWRADWVRAFMWVQP
jgi:hypothetical protein